MPPKPKAPSGPPAERSLPSNKNDQMLQEQDPAVLATKCRVQDVRFGGETDGVTETFVRIKTQLPKANMPHFIMRKAGDNYISATSMFRAVFYDATTKQEKNEMEVIRRELNARQDDNASGVWIPGSPDALQLADIYGIRAWVQALLDAPTQKSAYGDDKKSPSPAVNSPATKSTTPQVAATPSRKPRERSASPRKSLAASARKVKKNAIETAGTIKEDIAESISSAKDSASTNGMKISDILETVSDQAHEKGDKIAGTIKAKAKAAESQISTSLSEAGQSMSDLVADAKTQVDKAQKSDAKALSSRGLSKTKSTKRPLEDAPEDESHAVKKTKVDELRVTIIKERRKVRALMGLVIGLSATAILPYIL